MTRAPTIPLEQTAGHTVKAWSRSVLCLMVNHPFFKYLLIGICFFAAPPVIVTARVWENWSLGLELALTWVEYPKMKNLRESF